MVVSVATQRGPRPVNIQCKKTWGLKKATPRLLQRGPSPCPAFVCLQPRSKRHRGRSALGVEHPRSAVVARNLALVRGAGRCSDRVIGGYSRQDAATGGPGVKGWEEDTRHAIGGRRGGSTTDTANGDGRGLTNKRMERSLRLLPGGSPVSSMLPRASGDTVIRSDSGGGRRKRAGGRKKSGKVGSPRIKRV